MSVDVGAWVGGGVALAIAAGGHLLAWARFSGSVKATIDGLEMRVRAVEAELGTIRTMQADLARVEGKLDTTLEWIRASMPARRGKTTP